MSTVPFASGATLDISISAFSFHRINLISVLLLLFLWQVRIARPPQFDAWIDMYASSEFEKEVRDFIEMVDVAVKEADDETYQKMKEHFMMSCKLEHMFWDQAQNLMEWPNIIESV